MYRTNVFPKLHTIERQTNLRKLTIFTSLNFNNLFISGVIDDRRKKKEKNIIELTSFTDITSQWIP